MQKGISISINNAYAYSQQRCERCGSKKRISRKWEEKIPTLTGTTIVKCAQFICTNVVCQAAFDKNLRAELKKRQAIRRKKEENDAARKKDSLSKKALKNKSRI